MIEQFEIDYKGSKLLIEAKCSKTDDKYNGSNTCEIDIVSAYIIHDLDRVEEIALNETETDEITSMLAYTYMDDYGDRIIH